MLAPDTEILRYGGEAGRFASDSECSYPECSLPYEESSMPVRRYKVLKPLPCWESVAAPWFDQPGGAIQYRFTVSIRMLIAEGFLESVK